MDDLGSKIDIVEYCYNGFSYNINSVIMYSAMYMCNVQSHVMRYLIGWY